MRAEEHSESVFSLSSRPRTSGLKPLLWSHCQHRGHTEDRCWDKHPSVWPMRPTQVNNSQKEYAFLAETNIKQLIEIVILSFFERTKMT